MAAKFMKDRQGHPREALLTTLYQDAFPAVARHIGRMGGSFEEARDIFQDALIIYYEKLNQPGLVLKQTAQAYIFGISRYLWSKRYHQHSRHLPIEQVPADFEVYTALSDAQYEQVSASRLFQLLKTAGQKCMQLLSAFYYDKLDMDTLAERFGFSGPRSATVQKFKCLEKVKETVKTKSIRYEDILE